MTWHCNGRYRFCAQISIVLAIQASGGRRDGSSSTFLACPRHVGFTLDSVNRADAARDLKSANGGHCLVSAKCLYGCGAGIGRMLDTFHPEEEPFTSTWFIKKRVGCAVWSAGEIIKVIGNRRSARCGPTRAQTKRNFYA